MADQPSNTPCSRSKTTLLRKLFETPPSRRGEDWRQEFYDTLPEAALGNPPPKIFYGPDRFPYFHLETDLETGEGELFCLANLLEYLTTHGLGAAVNPSRGAQEAEWVFSYGDLLSFRLVGAFSIDSTASKSEASRASAEEQVLVAAPSEEILPEYARNVLGRYLKESLGVQEPGVLLLSRSAPAVQQLVFSIFPEDYPEGQAFQAALQSLRWFLPRHYNLGAVPRHSPIAGHFSPLGE